MVLDHLGDLVNFAVNMAETERRHHEEVKEHVDDDDDSSWVEEDDDLPASRMGDAANPEEPEDSFEEDFDPEQVPGAILRMMPASDDGESSMDLPVHQMLNDSVYDTGDSSADRLSMVSALNSDSEYAEISVESSSSDQSVFEFDDSNDSDSDDPGLDAYQASESNNASESSSGSPANIGRPATEVDNDSWYRDYESPMHYSWSDESALGSP